MPLYRPRCAKDGCRVLCVWSTRRRTALDDHFDGDNKDKLKVFKASRERIEHEARRKYLADLVESDGSVLIKTMDL
jgi:Protein of unknown function (DUF1488)